MDVVGGKIVAAQNKGSEHRFSLKRSPDSVLEGPSSCYKTNQLPSSWRGKQESRDWSSTSSRDRQSPARMKSEMCDDGFHGDLRGVFGCSSQAGRVGPAYNLRSPHSKGIEAPADNALTKFEPMMGLSGFHGGHVSRDGEISSKRATRSNRLPLLGDQLSSYGNSAPAKDVSTGGSAVTWSSPSLPENKPSDTPGVLLSPFYPPANPVFAQQGRTWVDPLRFLLKKELTATDVGELGRIVLPKRDAEGQLPHLDSKEGKLLTLEDYNSNKHWSLRYKWWPNNKSRMYVLESTGEFVKYHDLKDKDELIVYRDGVGKLVIRAQKWSSSVLRNGSDCGPHGYKGKNTGRRSPKGLNCRSVRTFSPTEASSSSAQVKMAQPVVTLDSGCENGSGKDHKESPTHSPDSTLGSTLPDVRIHCESNISGNSRDDQPIPPVANSQQSVQTELGAETADCCTLTSGPSAPILYMEQAELVPYGQISMQSDVGIDWEKLPDPSAIELPGSFEFPGNFEFDNWGDCI